MSRTQPVCRSTWRWMSSSRPPGIRSYIRYDPPKLRLPLNEIFNNDPTKGPLKLPGYGYSIDESYYSLEPDPYSWRFDPTTEAFCHGFSSWVQSRRNLVRELHMMRVMDALTDKEQWKVKVFDEAVIAKWKVEAMNLPGKLISELAWKWIVTELRWKADEYSRTGYITTLETCSTIVKGDALIEETVRKELQDAVKPLMARDEAEKDWHPGSDQKVLNLVHPSLYPLVYGRTRILPDRALGIDDCLLGMPGDGVITDVPQTPVLERYDKNGLYINFPRFPYPELWSTKFQWLPSDVEFIGPSGDKVQIVSYINNLHPAKHRDLYRSVEKVISRSIQPWNEVLRWNDLDEGILRIRHEGVIKMRPDPYEDEDHLGDIICDVEELEDEDIEGHERLLKAMKEFLAHPENPDYIPIPQTKGYDREHFDGSFEGQWWRDRGLLDELRAKCERVRVTEHPEPGVDKSFEDWKEARQKRLRPKIEEMFREKGLQVIVKLSSIELTPDKPEYGGGNWHLEGKMNEHIVATSIYYYDVDNVTESRIQFRQESQLDPMWDLEYSADDHGPIEDAYGARNLHNSEALQETGSIVTRQGRLLVFPNIVQHRVEPFRLKNPTKPGHRRFLVIWLVDPHYRVISTRNVAPQQYDWWKEEQSSGTRKVEPDTKEDFTNGIMQPQEAEQYRLELMQERSTVTDSVEAHYERYNFCEH